LPELLQEDAQLVVLGTGDGDLEAGFRYAASVNPDKVAVYIGYDEAMSHRFMAGADILVVPSRFEPCGLTQLYALRYGTLPLVRWVGGLADTVVDVNYEDRATGFVFGDASRQALGARIREACQFYRNNKSGWANIQQRAMRQDFSWDGSAANYEQLYRSLS
jgi:starch synthase